VNHDGVIEYEEFIPVALELLSAVSEMEEAEEAEASSDMPDVSDVPPEMLKAYLTKLFAVADANGDGVLQPEEFQRLLELSGFNFPAATVAQLIDAADVNHDGVIEYDEFIPVALEILKAQTGMTDRRQEAAASMPQIADVPDEMLSDYLRKLFAIADVNGDGVLSATEFADLLQRSGFNLPPAVILKLIREADTNEDGLIQYEEFIPAMLRLKSAPPEYFDDAPQVSSDMPQWNEVPEAMLEKYLGKLFAIGDSNGDGVLQPQEFVELLSRCGLRFPADVVLEIFLKADQNEDGVIQYEEFIPAMKAIIAGAKDAQQAVVSEMPDVSEVPPAMMERYLQKLFSVADTNGDGVLQPDEFRRLLELSGFNFPAETVAQLLDAADVNHDGVIEYEEFIPVALELLSAVSEMEEAEASSDMPDVSDVPPEMLERYLAKLFAVADVNGDGVLQPEELSRLLELSGFNFAPSQVAEIVAAADVNHDGVISYEEFIPVAVGIMKARAESGADPMPDLSEVPPPMLERYFKKLFTIADTNGDGVLQPEELEKLLGLSGFNFSRDTVAQIMSRADVNHDGVIEYNEFIPMAMEIIGIRKEAGVAPMPRLAEVPAPMLERYLQKLFTIADTNGDGVLQPSEFKRLLELSGFNFSPDQVVQLLDAADVNHDGVIEYSEFLPVAMSILQSQEDAVDTFIDQADEDAIRQMLLNGQTRPQLERMMKKLFLFADTDCSGFLDYQEFKSCLAQMNLGLSPVQVVAVMKEVDVNQDGLVSYDEFLPVAFELIVGIVAGKIQPQAAASRMQPATEAVEAPTRQGWTAYSSLYSSKTPSEGTVSKVSVTQDNTDVASLEGRVLSVQCRRIIRSKIKDLFARLDTDKDGKLSVAELTAAFGTVVARRLVANLDRNNDQHVTQYEMRRFFDDECTQATAAGQPEYKYLEGVVEILESSF